MLISFSKPIQYIDLDVIDLSALEYEVEPDVWQPVLTVHIEASEEQEPENVLLTSWNVTSITTTEM